MLEQLNHSLNRNINNTSNDGDIFLFQHLLERQALLNPEKIAVIYHDQSLTYYQLNQQANQFAHYLKKKGIAAGDLVGIYEKRGIELTGIIFGILKCDAICVPIDFFASVERIKKILSETQLKYLVSSQHIPRKLVDAYNVTTLNFQESQNLFYPCDNIKSKHLTGDTAYVLFTSGSTGKPKGVMLQHQGLVNLAYQKVQIIRDVDIKNILQFSSLAFDAMLSELGIQLVLGGTLVIADYEELLPGNPLISTLKKYHIDLIIAAPSILKTIMHSQLPNLKVIFSAGENCPINVAKGFSKNKVFVNAYGPTEASVCATMYRFQHLLAHQNQVPIGKPIFGCAIRVILPDGSEALCGDIGELYLGGIGVAKGYLNDEGLTHKSFVQIEGNRYYKTGDLVKRLEDGNLVFISRADRQIKYHGIRINLDEIEFVIRQHSAIANAAAVFNDGNFVLYLELEPSAVVDVGSIRSYLKQHFSASAIPTIIVFLKEFPYTVSNKIDYQALKKLKNFQQEDVVSGQSLTALEGRLFRLLRQYIQFKFSKEDNLFDCGLDSFSAVSFVDAVDRELNIDLPIGKVYEYPSIQALAQHIENIQQGKDDVVIDFRDEVHLDSILKETKYSYIKPSLQRDKNILITGATGFIGIFLLEKILKTTEKHVYCLIRAKDKETALIRIQDTATKYKVNVVWEKYLDRLHPVIGDLTSPCFGWSTGQYNKLTEIIGAIYHLAGNTSFLQSYEVMKTVNVIGTEEILRFATTNKLIPIHYISTLAIFSCIHFFEKIDTIAETADSLSSYPYLKYDIGYVQSKWVADQLLQQATKRGVPVTIYRPGFVLCHSETGAMEPSHFWHAFVQESIYLRAYPDLIEQKEEFVSVDFLVNALWYLSQQENSRGKIYHLCPAAGDNMDNIACFQQIANYLNLALKPLPYKEWLSLVSQHINKEGKKATIYPFLPLLRDKIYADYTALEVYQHTPNCINTIAEPALQSAHLMPPSMKSLLEKYARYLRREW